MWNNEYPQDQQQPKGEEDENQQLIAERQRAINHSTFQTLDIDNNNNNADVNQIENNLESPIKQNQESLKLEHADPPAASAEPTHRTSQDDIIYRENIYDKLTLSPLEKYTKYGRFPTKMTIHIILVLLTTSQILYSSNTLSTNSTEQFEQWRELFFQEESNKNIKNEDFENKILYYLTVQKVQNQLNLMFEEMNKDNSMRLQDIYFEDSQIYLDFYRNYPMYKSNDPDQPDGELVFEVDRHIGIVSPYDMRTPEGIKQAFSQAKILRIRINNVILVETTLVSCWEFHINYNLKGGSMIQAELMAEGGVCTEELFQKAIKYHSAEYPEDNDNDQVRIRQKRRKLLELLREQQSDENDKKSNRKNSYDRYFKEKTQKQSQKHRIAHSKQRKRQVFTQESISRKQSKQEQQRHLYSTYTSQQPYQRDGNLYKSGNLLFIGFNTFIDVLTLACSVWSLILGFMYLFQIADVYILTQQQSTRRYLNRLMTRNFNPQESPKKKSSKFITLRRILAEQRPWQELSLAEKLQYFDLWFFIIVIGNFFQATGSVYLLTLDTQSQFDQYTEAIDWTVGIGCFCSWFALLKYMEYSPRLALNLDVIKFALPQLATILIEFAPVFISFSIVGMTSFSQSERFADLSSTVVTLIGVVMADGIYDTIEDINENGVLPNFLADLYAILFVFMFLFGVTNVMIGILEDGYTRNKYERRYQKNIELLKDEKQRMVFSKQVLSKQEQDHLARRSFFDSDDDEQPYESRRQRKFQDLELPPEFKMINQQSKDNQVGNNNNYALSAEEMRKASTVMGIPNVKSPKIQMKMVAHAAQALSKAKRFVMLKRQKTEGIRTWAQQQMDQKDEETEKQLGLKGKSQMDLREKGREEGGEGEVEEERKESAELFRYRGRIMEKDEIKSSPSLNMLSIKDKEKEEEADNYEQGQGFQKQPKEVSSKEVFEEEMLAIKQSAESVENVAVMINKGRKEIKKILEENGNIIRNFKFFQMSAADQVEIQEKYSQYLMYFTQRVQSRLLEIEHFNN